MNSSKIILLCVLTFWSAMNCPAQTNTPPPVAAAPAKTLGVARELHARLRGNDAGIHLLTPAIVEYMAKLGCNVLRVHLDIDNAYRNLPTDKQPAPTPENPLACYQDNLKLLDSILPVCRQYGVQLILAAGDIYGRKTDIYWTGTVEGKNIREYCNQFWGAISERYKDEPAIVGYDIRNEPVYKKEEAASWWQDSLPECISTIRKNDSTVWIVVEPAMAFASEFSDMPLMDDPRVIYSFHSYWPHGYTHQGVRFRQGRYKEDSKGLWTYPGMAPRVEAPDLAHQKLTYWDKAAVKATMQPVIDFQKKHPGVRIFCGEFGVIRWAPNGAQYLQDVIDLLEEQGWDWTFHSMAEWNGWDPTYAAEDDVKHNRPSFLEGVKETDRFKVVTAGWALNQPPKTKTP